MAPLQRNSRESREGFSVNLRHRPKLKAARSLPVRSMARPPTLSTFSIVAYDAERKSWGVAVQSKFISVGAVVPWGEANVGALATQAHANVRYGPEGLALLRKGVSGPEVVRKLIEADGGRDHRQLGVVDARGRAAAHTGSKCLEWAGHEVGEGFTCQGNILFASAVVHGMARAFEATPGDLPERLFAALSAGQREGGDRRGMQSAAMLIVREHGGYDDGNDRWVDIRVDDHPSPIEEMRRVFELYDLTMLTREDPATLVTVTPEVAGVVQHHLSVLGYYHGRLNSKWDEPTQSAYDKFLNESNFESKARADQKIWPSVLNFLQGRAAAEVERRTRTAPAVSGALSKGPGAQGGKGSSPRTPPKGRSNG